MVHRIPLHLYLPRELWRIDGFFKTARYAVEHGVSLLWFEVGRHADVEAAKNLAGKLWNRAVLSVEAKGGGTRLLSAALGSGANGVAVETGAWKALWTAPGGREAIPRAATRSQKPTLRAAERPQKPLPRMVFLEEKAIGDVSRPSGRQTAQAIDRLEKASTHRAPVEGERMFLRLFHPDPVLNLALNRLLRERLGLPQVLTLRVAGGGVPFRGAREGSIHAGDAISPAGAIDIRDTLSVAGLLAEGIGDVLLLRPDAAPKISGLEETRRAGTRVEAPIRDSFEYAEKWLHPALSCAKSLLGALKLYPVGYELISCPTCGRCEVDVAAMAEMVDAGLKDLERDLETRGKNLEEAGGIVVAVMGCNVNGPGEARMADIGIAGGRNMRGTLFVRGKPLKTIPAESLVSELLAGAKKIVDAKLRKAKGR